MPAPQVCLDLTVEALHQVEHFRDGGMCAIHTARYRGRSGALKDFRAGNGTVARGDGTDADGRGGTDARGRTVMVTVVVKVPRDDCPQPQAARCDLETEISILSRLSSPHVVQLLGAGLVSPLELDGDGIEFSDFASLDSPPKRFLLLEYLSGGTLADKMGLGSGAAAAAAGAGGGAAAAGPAANYSANYSGAASAAQKIRRSIKKSFGQKRALGYALEIAGALRYLHQEAIDGCFVVHRDLKPENIAFAADGTLKLLDFGLARVVARHPGNGGAARKSRERYELTGATGSVRYMSPEVAREQPYDESVDIYSFGVILWEMLSFQRPFQGLTRSDFMRVVVERGVRPAIRPEWGEGIASLLERCWNGDPDERPAASEAEEILQGLLAELRGSWWPSCLSVEPAPAAAAAAGGGGVNGRGGGGNGGGGGGNGCGSGMSVNGESEEGAAAAAAAAAGNAAAAAAAGAAAAAAVLEAEIVALPAMDEGPARAKGGHMPQVQQLLPRNSQGAKLLSGLGLGTGMKGGDAVELGTISPLAHEGAKMSLV